jgi:callose synthase
LFLSKAFQDGTNSATFKIYVFVIGAYVGAKIIIGLLMSVPCCHGLTDYCYRWSVVRLGKWMHQENNYVGRGMHERPSDYIKYVAFWLAILGAKFSFTYFLQIEPLVKPTMEIINFKRLEYAWHDFVSKNNHNALTILSLWAPVVSIYLLDIHVFYTVMSAICGFLLGARDRLGEIRSVEAVHRFFEKFPEAFMDKLHVAVPKRKQLLSSSQVLLSCYLYFACLLILSFLLVELWDIICYLSITLLSCFIYMILSFSKKLVLSNQLWLTAIRQYKKVRKTNSEGFL